MKKIILLSILFLFMASVGIRLTTVTTGSSLVDDSGNYYLQDWDSYRWYHEAEHKDLKSPMAYVSYYFQKITDKSLMGAMSVLPLIIMPIVTILIFLIIYIITDSLVGAYIGGFLFTLNPSVFNATRIGVADNQLLIFLFMTTIMLLFYLLIKKENIYRKNGIPNEWVIAKKALIAFLMFVLIFLAQKVINHNPFIKPESYNNVIEQISYGFSAIFFIDHFALVLAVMGFCILYLFKDRTLKAWSLIMGFFILFDLSLHQIRFATYTIVFYCVLAGIGAEYLYVYLKSTKYSRIMPYILILPLLIITILNIPYYEHQTIIADDGTAEIGEYIPQNATILNYWPSGYMIQAFTDKDWIRFSGIPNTNELVIESLISSNIDLNNTAFKRLGKEPYLVLTQQDYEQIKAIYNTRADSLLNQLVMNKAEHFEEVYRSESEYNWIAVWRVR